MTTKHNSNRIAQAVQETTSHKQMGFSPLRGHPRINTQDARLMLDFLEGEFCSQDAEGLSPYLWVMSMQSPANVSPLHRQRVKQREVVVTEDPKLHLVWFHNRIFIKPLPEYLCDLDFLNNLPPTETKDQQQRQERIRKAAKGYLRTWVFLVRHKSDFRIAQEPPLQLLPPDMTWEKFCHFAASLHEIHNHDVSERYHYGEIRLSRLNFYCKIFLRKRFYQRMYPQYGDYFGRFFPPLLFILGTLSVFLSALQVVMAVKQVSQFHWRIIWVIARWSGLACAIVPTIIILALLGTFWVKFTLEWKRALGDRWQTRRNRESRRFTSP